METVLRGGGLGRREGYWITVDTGGKLVIFVVHGIAPTASRKGGLSQPTSVAVVQSARDDPVRSHKKGHARGEVREMFWKNMYIFVTDLMAICSFSSRFSFFEIV